MLWLSDRNVLRVLSSALAGCLKALSVALASKVQALVLTVRVEAFALRFWH